MSHATTRNIVRPILWSWGAMALLATGCVDQTIAYLHVDNASELPYEVRVDGELAGIAIPHDHTAMKVPVGNHHVEVTRQGETIYQSMREIQKGSSLWSRNYLLNPDNEYRYACVKILYGDDSLAKAGADTMVRMAAWAGDKEITEADRMMMRHKELRNDAVPYGDDPWFEIPPNSRILKGLPETVYTKNNSETRRTLIRVPGEIHEYLQKASQLTEVTEDQVEELYAVVALVEEMIPMED